VVFIDIRKCGDIQDHHDDSEHIQAHEQCDEKMKHEDIEKPKFPRKPGPDENRIQCLDDQYPPIGRR